MKVKVDMSECIKKMVDDFSIESDKINKTPAAEHSFVVDPNSPKLDEKQKQVVELHRHEDVLVKKARNAGRKEQVWQQKIDIHDQPSSTWPKGFQGCQISFFVDPCVNLMNLV